MYESSPSENHRPGGGIFFAKNGGNWLYPSGRAKGLTRRQALIIHKET
jgi:hypothetical protein